MACRPWSAGASAAGTPATAAFASDFNRFAPLCPPTRKTMVFDETVAEPSAGGGAASPALKAGGGPPPAPTKTKPLTPGKGATAPALLLPRPSAPFAPAPQAPPGCSVG